MMPRVPPASCCAARRGRSWAEGHAHTRKNAQRAKGKPRPRIMRERVHAGRGHVTRTKRAGTAAIPPPWPTAQIVLLRPEPPPFPTMPKKARGVHAAHRPSRWKNAACRSPANRWGLGQSRRLASARCRVQATRPRTTRPHEAQRRKRAKSGRKMAGVNAQARPASGAQVRTPACAGILAPLPHGQKV